MKKIQLGKDIEIDLEKLIDSKLLIQANSGGGKSWAIRRILEQSHGSVQHIILDPEGEFGTLREKYDYILAAKDGDTPADPRSAALLAKKLLELKVSAVIDLYELHPQERKHFVKLFLDAMVNAPKELWHPVLVVIDEAHTFAPEKGDSEALNSVIGLASLGRKRGFGVIMATQRISKLHKDAAAECNNKLIGRTGLDIDRKRASEEIGFTSKEDVLSLRTLEPGQFYVFGPAISMEVKKEKVGIVHTSHPRAGARVMTQTVPPTNKIKQILGKLADLPAEAKKEATTVADLKNLVTSLKKELTSRKAPETDPKKISAMIDKAVINARKFWESELNSKMKELKHVSDVFYRIKQMIPETLPVLEFPKPTSGIHPITVGSHNIEQVMRNVIKVSKEWPPVRFEMQGDSKVESVKILGIKEGPNYLLTLPEKKILNAIAWMNSIGIEAPEQTAVAFLADYVVDGGGFKNPRGSLRTKGLIEYQGSQLVLTEAGKEVAEAPDNTLTVEELHRKVLAKLPTPEQRLLKPLLAHYPQDMTNEELAEASGYIADAGGFKNPRGRLRSLGLISGQNGRIKASNVLFPEM